IIGNCSFQLFFFFQAEDGIRDATVTGVQTCALPILGKSREKESSRKPRRCDRIVESEMHLPICRAVVRGSPPSARRDLLEGSFRSEERRVGKEGRLQGGRKQRRK